MNDRHVSTQYLKINKKDGHNIVSETDPCNFQFLITEFKMGFQKKKPKIITYRNYKAFFQNIFDPDNRSTYRKYTNPKITPSCQKKSDKIDKNIFRNISMFIFSIVFSVIKSH